MVPVKSTVALQGFAASAAAKSIIDLSGDGWTVQNLPLNISIPGSLPSQAHLDLLTAQVIGDPYYALNDFEIAYGLGTLLEGGSGTTSSAMQSFCLAMWHYPEWQTKIQKEVDQVVGDQRTPSFDDWPALPTVRAAMKETLRWRPVVPNGEYHPGYNAKTILLQLISADRRNPTHGQRSRQLQRLNRSADTGN